jgi:hypothetical protein
MSSGTAYVWRQRGTLYQATLREHHCTFYRIAQFTHIAGPVVVLQTAICILFRAIYSGGVSLVELAEEMTDE